MSLDRGGSGRLGRGEARLSVRRRSELRQRRCASAGKVLAEA
ncbi:hypothetical protein HMPREF1556_01666 [Porphyromonas sp. oral taxon 278 str. W7784]|nr:hypothetical protein HMPREF1556_01666 [Porphyromonas sp. oral taxon 278 str. W7784]